MLIRCGDLWCCCYAAEMFGVVATVCTRRDGGGHVNVPATSYIIRCYAAEISAVVATVCTRRGGVGWGGAC
jgi:hypothetical protein